ncbi:MAG: GNAT family N-acetyltransferase [Parachlamydiales bacterium]|nr:GNAT family N-acetyltransferase [Parachlamydiales bacterium]
MVRITRLDSKSPPTLFLEIAKLHKDQLKVGLFAELNERQLAKFYHQISAMPHLASLFVCIDEKENICGFASATLNIKSLYSEYIKKWWFFLIEIFLTFIIQPKFYRRIFSVGKYLHAGPNIGNSINAEILSFVVSPSRHRNGIGKKMFDEIRKYFSLNHVSNFKVTTSHTQISAQYFYCKMGGKCLGNIDLGSLTSSIYEFENHTAQYDTQIL